MNYSPRGWHSRNYLPHFDGGEITQFVTFHLTDSFPVAALKRWKEELAFLPKDEASRECRERIEAYLDTGQGEAWLKNPPIAQMVEDALLFFDGQRYLLHAWVVMPNHVHALFTPILPFSLSGILNSWKSYTAHEANKMLGRQGDFWFPDYFDRYIRDETHFVNTVAYIEGNPVMAGLCAHPVEWPWSSAAHRLNPDILPRMPIRG